MAFSETNLTQLKIYSLPKAQYDALVQAGTLDEDAIYLTTANESGSDDRIVVAESNSATSARPIYFSTTDTPAETLTQAAYNNSVGVIPATGVLKGAAWNDYAEYRKVKGEPPKPGTVVCETGHDSVVKCYRHMAPAPAVVSDTFGFVIGDEEGATVPIAVAGKVLVYYKSNVKELKAGDAVCASDNGMATKMSRTEIKTYPDRILGYFVGIPEEDEFNGVPVDGRIWIRVR